MTREPVNSSVLQSAGYDAETCTLELEFKDNGAVWQYLNLPVRVYKKFVAAASKGNFFVTQIKGRYPEKRLI